MVSSLSYPLVQEVLGRELVCVFSFSFPFFLCSFGRCCPMLFHDISVDVPTEEKRKTVRLAFLLWNLLFFTLIFDVFALMLGWILDDSSGDGAKRVRSSPFVLTFFPFPSLPISLIFSLCFPPSDFCISTLMCAVGDCFSSSILRCLLGRCIFPWFSLFSPPPFPLFLLLRLSVSCCMPCFPSLVSDLLIG